MQPFVYPLQQEQLSLADVGGKAFNLGILLRAGIPVPKGVVVTTAGYRAFVEANDLGPRIAATLACAGEAEALESTSAELRQAFETGRVPDALASAILEAVLPEQQYAVRSSATAEDLPEASFAGQQDTFLNIRGEEAPMLSAIRRCWGSLFTARAMAYRQRRGILPEQVALAVVIQELVPAEAAGVLFTRHPITSGPQRVINAVWGLGEALVSGRVNPDTLLIDTRSGHILASIPGDKAVMTALDTQGTSDVEVDAERRGTVSVTAAQVEALVALGQRLEVLFGTPQDIEWVMHGGVPQIVQSRAITTGPASVGGDDDWPPPGHGEAQPFDFWTQQDMGERWPDPVTPLTWSVSEPMNHDIFEGMLAGLKAPYAGRIEWTRRICGHVYMNEGALLYAYTHGFGMPLKYLESGLTHPAAAPADANRWRLGQVLRHLGLFMAMPGRLERNVRQFEAAFPQIDAWVDGFMERDLSQESDTWLLDEAQQVWYARVLEHVAWHGSATSLAMQSYTQLEQSLHAWLGDASEARTLAGGISGVIAAELVPAVNGLAEMLRATGLDALVIELPPKDALMRLRQSPEATGFLEALRQFLRRHGHRCMVEAELRYPRWAEAPELVVEQLATLLKSPGAPTIDLRQAERRREEATQRVMAQLGWFRRSALERLLEKVWRYSRLRDNGQHYVVKLLMPMRHLLALLGERWAERGWLKRPDDVFFLVQEELRAVTSAGGHLPLEVQGKADARRRAFDHWCAQAVPEALDAAGQPVAPAECEPGVLVGLGASHGVVTGPARVILDPADASRIRPGDILVTRATDPGWTPVFSLISGAVIEIGGMLSHGAIVAREYGIPAVMGVSQATRRIQEGDMLRVDGGTGRVTVVAPRLV